MNANISLNAMNANLTLNAMNANLTLNAIYVKTKPISMNAKSMTTKSITSNIMTSNSMYDTENFDTCANNVFNLTPIQLNSFRSRYVKFISAQSQLKYDGYKNKSCLSRQGYHERDPNVEESCSKSN